MCRSRRRFSVSGIFYGATLRVRLSALHGSLLRSFAQTVLSLTFKLQWKMNDFLRLKKFIPEKISDIVFRRFREILKLFS
jgi:hypothetical protein